MVKHQEEESEDLSIESPSKKHKKHKKHKHKKKRDADDSFGGDEDDTGSFNTVMLSPGTEEDVVVDVVSPTSQPPAIKLKIKFGGQPVAGSASATNAMPITAPMPSTPSTPKMEGIGTPTQGLSPSSAKKLPRMPSSTALDSPWQPKDDVFITKKAGDDTSDEEKEWLDALEAGTLDDNGEVKRKRDASLLTSRQRALLHGNREDLMSLPSGYKQTELTEEQLVKRQQKAKKRREQAAAKQEKDKKQILERLLKKQESSRRGKGKGLKRSQAPGYRYHNVASAVTISVPQGFNFPFHAQPPKQAPPAKFCGVEGCSNEKKYSCSKTGVPLCSLQCYKKNLELHHMSGGSKHAVGVT